MVRQVYNCPKTVQNKNEIAVGRRVVPGFTSA